MGSDVFVIDGLKMSRHASHYSIPQAITCVLDLCVRAAKTGAPPPSLTLLTDLTHRFEHHALDEAVRRHMNGLRAWAHAHKLDASNAPPRWWTEPWDASENEAHERLHLNSDGTSDEPSALVPPMRVAFDGAQIAWRILNSS